MIAACTDGTIVAFRGAKPEEELWRFKMDGTPGAMILAEGTLYVSGSDQTLYAIDPKKGTKLWRRVMPALIMGRIARSGPTVCVAVRDGKVHFLDAATGDSLWTYETQGPIQGGVSVIGSLVLFGSDDQSVFAFDLAFRALAWKLKVKGKVRLAPAGGKGVAYIGNDEGIYAVELN
jgi:outer membrane protein assembly factor BamB